MKKRNPTDQVLEILHPQSLIAALIEPAIKPFVSDLLASAKADRAAMAEMEKTHPNVIKAEADKLLEAATAGDAEAEKKLREAGGRDQYIKTHTAFFDLAKGKHHHACEESIVLWEKVSAAVLDAFDKADRDIQAQWEKVCAFLGEPSDVSRWSTYCRNIRNGILNAPRHAADPIRHGTDWQLRALGFADIVGLP